MSKTAKRMGLATLLSLLGFATTLTWYKLSDSGSTSDNQAKPIARLVSKINDVQKKSVRKIIWQEAQDNEILRAGEAVRTAASSEARIEFLNSNAAIDLEPDSAIILEETDGKLALEFLQGNISVDANQSNEAGSPQLTLVSGGKKVSLGKSQLTLGRNAKGEMDVNILKGEVAGLSPSSSKIKVLSPQMGESLYINNSSGDLAQFEWQPLAQGYTVQLEYGLNREDMTILANASAAGEVGKLKADVAVGKIFFRLRAKSENPAQPEIYSPVLRASVYAKIPPQLLAPEKESLVTVNSADPEIQFLWSNPAQYKKIIFELATSADFKNKIKTEYLENTNRYVYSAEKNGVYFWRVSGVLDGKKDVVSSQIQKFKVAVLNSILAPELERPRAGERIPVDLAQNPGVPLSWKHSPGADRYKVVVESMMAASARTPASVKNVSSKKVFEAEDQALQTVVKDLPPGQYAWTVSSIDKKNEASAPSEKRIFYVQKVPTLEWADGKREADYFYLSLKPSLNLEWKPGDLSATSWEVTVKQEDQAQAFYKKKTTSLFVEIDVPADGQYVAEVEAYSDKNTLLGRTPPRSVRVLAAPLLPPPAYASTVPQEITATGNGSAQVQWVEVKNAHQYVLITKTPSGTTQEYKFNSLQGALNNLMPGEYKLSLRSVDKSGRVGPAGEERTLKVPDLSSMRAPKLKGVKIK